MLKEKPLKGYDINKTRRKKKAGKYKKVTLRRTKQKRLVIKEKRKNGRKVTK